MKTGKRSPSSRITMSDVARAQTEHQFGIRLSRPITGQFVGTREPVNR
jgi:hypothetical protein